MKNQKLIFSLLLISLVLVSFLPQFVSAQEEQEGVFVVLGKAFFGEIGEVFSSVEGVSFFEKIFQGEDFKNNLAFFLLVVIFVLFVYDIMDFLPFFNKNWMKVVFSMIFGILAFLFFDQTQIEYLLTTYEAVGVTIVAIIPFLVILAFTWKLEKKAREEVKPSYSVINKGIWTFFGIYLILRWYELGFNYENPISIAYLTFGIVALAMILLQKPIFQKLMKSVNQKIHQMGSSIEIENQIRKLRLQESEIVQSLTLPENMENEEKQKRLNTQLRKIRAQIAKINKMLS
jgi:hypothetical protein